MRITIDIPDELDQEVLDAFAPTPGDDDEPLEPDVALEHVETQLRKVIAGRVASQRAAKIEQETRDTLRAAQADAVGTVAEAFGVDLRVRDRDSDRPRNRVR